MAHFDLPIRNRKDLARAAQLRNYSLVGRPFSSRPPIPPSASYNDDPYLPIPAPRHRPNRSLSAIYHPEPALEAHLPLSTPYRPPSYPHRHVAGADNSHSPNNTRQSLPYARAARALYHALTAAVTSSENLERSFEQELRSVPYADEPTRRHLWALKVAYSGWNPDTDDSQSDEPGDHAGAGGGNAGAPQQEDYFAKRAGRLLDAIEDLRCAEHPAHGARPGGQQHEWAYDSRWHAQGYDGFNNPSGVGFEDVRLAMKKLSVSFGAIAELLEGVRSDPGRVAVLSRELRSAAGILLEVRESWEVRPRPRGRNGNGNGNGNGVYRSEDGRVPIPVPLPAFTEVTDSSSCYD